MNSLPTEFRTGQRVIWTHRPRGGYGYALRVPATVVGFTRCRVVIEVRTRTLGEFKRVRARTSSLVAVPEAYVPLQPVTA